MKTIERQWRGLALSALLASVLVAVSVGAQFGAEGPVSMRAAVGTRWLRSEVGLGGPAELLDGTLSIEVHEGSSSGRVVLRVPDGEISDIGTRFQVSVTGGKTDRIVVSEGAVTFWPRHGAARTIRAGELWVRPPEPHVGVR